MVIWLFFSFLSVGEIRLKHIAMKKRAKQQAGKVMRSF
jgi:hypothetical protein